MEMKDLPAPPGMIRCNECGLLFDASLFFVEKKQKGKTCIYCQRDKEKSYYECYTSTDYGKDYKSFYAFCSQRGIKPRQVTGELREIAMSMIALRRMSRKEVTV